MPTPIHQLPCFCAALVLVSLPGTLLAQWPSYPTAGVPRTPDEKPNLSAPAPRTPAGRPDFTGIWQNDRTVGGTVAARSGAKPPTTNEDLLALARRSPFWNIGSQFKDGLPFTPWGAELHQQRVADNSRGNPDAHCLPMGIMQFHNHSQPRKIIQTPQVIVILYEANAGIRQIFTDGRPLPNDPDPWWYGYSTGHWEGDTLVVESAGFRDGGWLDVEGSPLSDVGHVIERFRRPDFGHLEIAVTIDDPKAYTKPWTVTVHQHILVDTELIEFVCQENEQDSSHLTAK
ncbi:MAG TPA: hypothetical protein VMU80_14995 [Bryobacteraceae bacterium]|nr:hypothetical protein [Bryobacteraceae bacterium]HUO30529.1 hypothetical protein [Bryobacteraceae bacterium]